MSDPQICATVTGRTADEIRRARDAASAADLVELRLDSMARPDPAAALADRKRPAIVTCRAARDGGGFRGSEEERRRLLADAASLGAEFIDVEWDAGFEPLIAARRGRGVIVSLHDFDGMPADLPERVAAMRATGAEVVKVAISASRLSDLIALRDLAPRGPDADVVLIAMGAAGVPSRVLPAAFGSRWTYAGDSVAPGQVPLDRLLHEFRIRRIRPDAALYGVAGRPVTRSLSPAMHNAGFAALSLNAAYVPLEAADAEDFRQFADAFGLRGASVTTPFKIELAGLADEVSPVAHAVGAINTLVRRDGRWTATNTDVDGFLEPLRGRVSLRGTRATVLGSGGAARAVAVALSREGAAVTIAARNAAAARDVAEQSGARVGPWPPAAASWDLLVNATTCGSAANPGMPIPASAIGGRLVYDLVYEPDPTPLMSAARDAGVEAIGGLEMLVAQAERQFETWTGQRPPRGLFHEAALQALSLREGGANLRTANT
ncbi:MAG TPA: type I 3-dehydroquinate dehydratase [Vicinamibacterales bacterium]|nr:type I 3-dehydroquinate dehydratase [Vicinamibacterales bacterium]